jgi:hypothetical protein
VQSSTMRITILSIQAPSLSVTRIKPKSNGRLVMIGN